MLAQDSRSETLRALLFSFSSTLPTLLPQRLARRWNSLISRSSFTVLTGAPVDSIRSSAPLSDSVRITNTRCARAWHHFACKSGVLLLISITQKSRVSGTLSGWLLSSQCSTASPCSGFSNCIVPAITGAIVARSVSVFLLSIPALRRASSSVFISSVG
ncbi:hypothetical protein MOMOMM191B_18820 [Morganella morganii]